MHTLWNRANAVFFYALSVLLCLAAASAVTTLWMEPKPVIHTLRVNRLLTLRGQQESLRRVDVQDRAILTFDLDADLSGVFNWNVKQLFVYISATYKTATNEFNEVVIWDRVVNRTGDAHLRLVNAYNKYPLVDQRAELRGTPVVLSLSWDAMPITGILKKTKRDVSRIRMPAEYCTEVGCTVEPLPLDDTTTVTTAAGAPPTAKRKGKKSGAGSAAAAGVDKSDL